MVKRTSSDSALAASRFGFFPCLRPSVRPSGKQEVSATPDLASSFCWNAMLSSL